MMFLLIILLLRCSFVSRNRLFKRWRRTPICATSETAVSTHIEPPARNPRYKTIKKLISFVNTLHSAVLKIPDIHPIENSVTIKKKWTTRTSAIMLRYRIAERVTPDNTFLQYKIDQFYDIVAQDVDFISGVKKAVSVSHMNKFISALHKYFEDIRKLNRLNLKLFHYFPGIKKEMKYDERVASFLFVCEIKDNTNCVKRIECELYENIGDIFRNEKVCGCLLEYFKNRALRMKYIVMEMILLGGNLHPQVNEFTCDVLEVYYDCMIEAVNSIFV